MAKSELTAQQIGTHASHCCAYHGCQYGDDEICPVVLGTAEQGYLCEECPSSYEEAKTLMEETVKRAIDLFDHVARVTKNVN